MKVTANTDTHKKVLCHGQKRLKGAFERLQTILPSMVEDDDTKENEVIYAWTVYF